MMTKEGIIRFKVNHVSISTPLTPFGEEIQRLADSHLEAIKERDSLIKSDNKLRVQCGEALDKLASIQKIGEEYIKELEGEGGQGGFQVKELLRRIK